MSAKRLDELRSIDPVLTTLAQLHKNELFLSEKIFSAVKVKKTKGKFPIYGKEAFIARNTERAIRADSNRIPASEFRLEPYETQEQDLEMAVDYLECSQSSNYDKYEQTMTKQLWDSLALNREIEISEYLQNPTNFNIGNLTEIANDQSFNKPTSTLNPIKLISETKEKIRTKTGVLPNTIILNNNILNAILTSTYVQGLCSYSSFSLPTMNLLKEHFEIENILISTAVYSEKDNDFKNVWGNNILMTFSDINSKSTKKELPAMGHIIQLEGMPEVDTYFENGGKVKIIRCTDNFCWKVTMPEAGHLITNVVS